MRPARCPDNFVAASTYLTALAALPRSAISDLTSLASPRLTQHRQHRAKRLSPNNAGRQRRWSVSMPERALSFSAVVEKAETVVRMTVETHFAPNKSSPGREFPKAGTRRTKPRCRQTNYKGVQLHLRAMDRGFQNPHIAAHQDNSRACCAPSGHEGRHEIDGLMGIVHLAKANPWR